MNGIQLASQLRAIKNMNFKIILISADEILNEDNLFD